MNPKEPKGRNPEPADARDAFESIAADWIARRNGGPLTPAEQAEFDAWLAADPHHAKAFAEMEGWWAAFNAPRKIAEAREVPPACRASETTAAGVPPLLAAGDATPSSRLPDRGAAPSVSRRRKTTVFAAVGLAAAAAVAIAFLQVFAPNPAPPATDSPEIRSIAIRPDRQHLPDGSTAELNAGARIEVVFTPERRDVRLVKGEALFQVTSDPARPFVVTAGGIEVRAVGTAFSVRYHPAQVNVVVTEGRVAVGRSAPAVPADVPGPERSVTEPVFLDAGSGVALPADASALAAPPAVERLSPARLAAALAWRERRIEFSDTPLTEAVKIFNRQNPLQIMLGETSLQKRSITGIFWSDDPETFARLLETGFELKTERRNDRIVLYDGKRAR